MNQILAFSVALHHQAIHLRSSPCSFKICKSHAEGGKCGLDFTWLWFEDGRAFAHLACQKAFQEPFIFEEGGGGAARICPHFIFVVGLSTCINSGKQDLSSFELEPILESCYISRPLMMQSLTCFLKCDQRTYVTKIRCWSLTTKSHGGQVWSNKLMNGNGGEVGVLNYTHNTFKTLRESSNAASTMFKTVHQSLQSMFHYPSQMWGKLEIEFWT